MLAVNGVSGFDVPKLKLDIGNATSKCNDAF